MAVYTVDTNACIAHLRSAGTSSVSQRLAVADPGSIVICSVVRTELLFESYRSRDPVRAIEEAERFFSPLLSAGFDDDAARECARLRADLRSLNQQIGPYDSLIASIALVNSHVLITRNVAEFSRVSGLRIENWQ
jgi:tRNA(fMet)-specific endonuclease VapC